MLVLIERCWNIQYIAVGCSWLRCRTLVRASILTPVQCCKHLQCQKWTTEESKKGVCVVCCVCVVCVWDLLGEEMAPGCTMGGRRNSGWNNRTMFCWETLAPAFYVIVTLTYHLPKDCCRVHLFIITIPWWHWPLSKIVQIVQISIQSNISELCWTNMSDPWRPHFATSRT